jgi:hypothetical protein
LVPDVFPRAHRGLAKLREPAALKAWLATVTVRVAHRRLRARRLRAVLSLSSDYDYSNLPHADLSPEERTMASEVFEALDKLPVAERLAWSLRHIQGEQLETVARLTGAPGSGSTPTGATRPPTSAYGPGRGPSTCAATSRRRATRGKRSIPCGTRSPASSTAPGGGCGSTAITHPAAAGSPSTYCVVTIITITTLPYIPSDRVPCAGLLGGRSR